MLDVYDVPSPYGNSDVQTFMGKCTVAGAQWETWQKPRGKTMLDILLVGKGGNGGTGVVGGNSVSAGGGGGGSGSITRLLIPLVLIPDTLYLSLAGQAATTTLASYISIAPTTVANTVLAIANGGGNGGNGTAATAGTAGAAGAIATIATMPFGSLYATFLAGVVGTIGGGTVLGPPMTLPLTGQFVTGGTGGGGLPGAGAVGLAGGLITAVGALPINPGGIGGTAAAVPPGNGSTGMRPIYKLLYGYGGTGGGSTFGTATTTGLVQSTGGHGAPGCGGGGNGGALTGSVAAVTTGQGGVAFAILTCW